MLHRRQWKKEQQLISKIEINSIIEKEFFMKKKLLLVLALVAMISTSAVFAQGSDEKKDSADEKVTINVMYWDNVQKPVIDQAVVNFEAANPNITVESSIVPWAQYWQKLQTSTVAGTAPDVFWMNVPTFPKYANNGLLLNLSDYVAENNVDITKYPSTLIDLFTKDGNLYAIPENYDTIAMVYNKALFDEAGVDYPTADWTWDDLLTAAKKLTKDTDDGKQYGYMASYENQSGYYNFIASNGGYIISDDKKSSGFDTKESKEAMQFLVDMIYKYGVSPDGQTMLEVNSPLDLFTSGRVAMTTCGDWSAPLIRDTLGDKADFVAIPKSPNTNERKVIIHGLGWTGYAKTKHPEATFKFIQYLTSKEFNKVIGESGIVIPAYEGMADDWVNAIPEYNLQVFIDAVDYSYPYPFSNNTSEWMNYEVSAIKDAFTGTTTSDEAMNKIAAETNKILSQE